jgi:hypothetical protein
VVTDSTDSEGVNEVNLVIGAATELIAFWAGGAVEGGIEFVHIHIIPMTTDMKLWELGKKDLNYVKSF